MNVTFHQKIIVLNKSGHFLALKASYKGNKWDLPGGEVEIPELHYEALKRELAEEAGIKLGSVTPVVVQTGFDKDHEIYYVFVGYKASVDTDQVRLSDEHLEYRWVTPEEFRQLDATPYLYDFVKEAFVD